MNNKITFCIKMGPQFCNLLAYVVKIVIRANRKRELTVTRDDWRDCWSTPLTTDNDILVKIFAIFINRLQKKFQSLRIVSVGSDQQRTTWKDRHHLHPSRESCRSAQDCMIDCGNFRNWPQQDRYNVNQFNTHLATIIFFKTIGHVRSRTSIEIPINAHPCPYTFRPAMP